MAPARRRARREGAGGAAALPLLLLAVLASLEPAQGQCTPKLAAAPLEATNFGLTYYQNTSWTLTDAKGAATAYSRYCFRLSLAEASCSPGTDACCRASDATFRPAVVSLGISPSCVGAANKKAFAGAFWTLGNAKALKKQLFLKGKAAAASKAQAARFTLALSSKAPAFTATDVCVNLPAAGNVCNTIEALCGGAQCQFNMTTTPGVKKQACCVPMGSVRLACPPGQGGSATGACSPCAPGTFGAGGLGTTRPCEPCQGERRFSAGWGAATCSACAAGLVANADHTGCVPVMPDFLVTGLTLLPPAPAEGSNFTASFTLVNAGNASAAPGLVLAWADRPAAAACGAGLAASADALANLTAPLAPGDALPLSFPGLPAGPAGGGNRTLRVMVDASCLAAEGDERDNQAALQYAVSGVPDFAFSLVSVITPSEPEVGGMLTAFLRVTNAGTGPGAPGTVQLWPDAAPGFAAACGAAGNYSAAWASPLAPGEDHDYVFSGLPAPVSPGKFTLRAFVDAGCAVSERSEANNEITIDYTVVPPRQPDFGFMTGAVSISPVTPLVNTTVKVSAYVINNGVPPASPRVVRLWPTDPGPRACGDGAGAFTAVYNGTLQQNAITEYVFENVPVPATPGSWSMRLFVDADCEVPEGNEADNQITVTFTAWSRLLPDFFFPSPGVDMWPSPVEIGKEVTFVVRVGNQGQLPAAPGLVQVWLYDPGPLSCGDVGNVSVNFTDPIFGYQTSEATFTATAPSAPTSWRVRALVDSDCRYDELDETNNEESRSFAVVEPMFPDFSFMSWQVVPTPARANETVKIYVNFWNAYGTARAAPGIVRLWLRDPGPQPCNATGDAEKRFTYQLLGFSPDTLVVDAVAPAVPGDWAVRAFLDADCEVHELNEGNNQDVHVITVV